MNNIHLTSIGIPTPTSIDLAYNQRSWSAYAEAVTRAGGQLIQIDITQPEAALRTAAEICDGFLLPGSPADVDPSLYDTPRIDACGSADPARERADFLLLHHAQATRKPVLGICYGCQSINTFFGGTLIQDLSPLPVNHEAGAKVAIAHTVVVEPKSRLESILLADAETNAEVGHSGTTNSPTGPIRLPVNTSHHQAVARPGTNIRIVARCPDDGVGEAIEPNPLFHVEHPAFLLGVQWHPERSIDISAASRALFAHLVAQAREGQSTETRTHADPL